jgi:hypothetical protein
MSTARVVGLAAARLFDAPAGHRTLTTSAAAPTQATAVVAHANCGIAAMAGASFTSKWYRNPEWPMSQSERLPS